MTSKSRKNIVGIVGYLVSAFGKARRKYIFVQSSFSEKISHFRDMMKAYFAFIVFSHCFVAVTPTWCSRSSGNCGLDQVCCNNQCITGSSCFGRSCTIKSDCHYGESCCSSVCMYGLDCDDTWCVSDSDCGYLNCCNGICQYDDCYDWTAIILCSIFGSLGVIFIIAVCTVFACRRQRRLRGGRVIVGPRVTTTTTVRSTPQSIQPYHSLPYQQGYPYYPPPQYEQHQTNRPPPYNPGPSAASGQPPPYTGEPQGTAGRVYTPKPSYGAVASAPPV